MKISADLKWYAAVSSLLIIISVVSYGMQIYIFHNEHDTYFYLLQDISFVPIQVLIVTFFIDRLLKKQHKINLMKKVNVTIGIFFNELGNELMKILSEMTVNRQSLDQKLNISTAWQHKDYTAAEVWINSNSPDLRITKDDVIRLKAFFYEKKFFILDLLENSNLSEHDTFTDSLLAVSHLSDELSLRKNIDQMPAADLNHLLVDIKRAYNSLILEWLLYMKHIRKEYPFLFSLAVRSNPFNRNSSVVIYE
jgi:hypothetical protein